MSLEGDWTKADIIRFTLLYIGAALFAGGIIYWAI